MVDGRAVFFTWTTYGTWLPGDPRGYVSNTLRPEGGYERRHNIPGTPFTRDDRYTYETAQQLMSFPPVVLSPSQASWAAEGLIDAARQNGWRIVRAAIMATHVHLVVPLADDKPWWIQKILKGRSSHTMSGRHGKTWRWWAQGARKDIVSGDDSMAQVMRYIEDQEHILVRIVDNTIVSEWPAR